VNFYYNTESFGVLEHASLEDEMTKLGQYRAVITSLVRPRANPLLDLFNLISSSPLLQSEYIQNSCDTYIESSVDEVTVLDWAVKLEGSMTWKPSLLQAYSISRMPNAFSGTFTAFSSQVPQDFIKILCPYV